MEYPPITNSNNNNNNTAVKTDTAATELVSKKTIAMLTLKSQNQDSPTARYETTFLMTNTMGINRYSENT